MDILPPVTLPPNKPLVYRHNPAPSNDYHSYRKCLRWEFGFTCPFCLIHDADVVRDGKSDGLGLTGVEHILPQSTHTDDKHIYANCVYCCQKCNRARSTAPSVDKGGRRLLNPTVVAWSDHFTAGDDRVEAIAGDADAEYTEVTYHLNDPRKVQFRRFRRKVYENHFGFLQSRPETKADLLLQTAQNPSISPAERANLVSIAKGLHDEKAKILEDLSTYAGIPSDAPSRCRCGTTDQHSLPDAFKSQLIQI
ncbi:MAG TPA: hypothetical protein VGM98_16240 [Schlesneria sp.]|jgi:5-methylcytosine-specific restriction endonuclease McrA